MFQTDCGGHQNFLKIDRTQRYIELIKQSKSEIALQIGISAIKVSSGSTLCMM